MMVVARSTLCFQSSLNTLARAPMAASDDGEQKHVNKDTHTKAEIKKRSNKEKAR